ncbi:hypothetical protein A2392_02685 [Candidatus Kaiserbacteria bacterium RIFOXYB1_FULL_46_14]|uniref:HTH deoR-type domain-containing protein n=1 Tax=Candidatus Kaiserbacteria bacterium RIFOXYB1_FULL_46_14 TaxID=1798531 RepID=A0A1F6FIH6_9BACT|nr:MAG: hypothetical protein A2392_02685 [Candidatus Kaiserbacteria bacterium RIFOXYB1_FULL_46_14]
MDTRDIIKATESTKRLVQDESYYKYIFKKTERIVSVVFYVASTLEKDKRTEVQLEDILETAREVHNAILRTLEARAHLAEESIRAAAHSLIKLDSKLNVAAASSVIAPEVLHVITSEIDGVLRGLNKYLIRTTAFDDLDYKVMPSSAPARENSRPRGSGEDSKENNVSERAESNKSEVDRRERIKVVLSAKGEATIKDISDIITDVSTKTIQRELNSMIEDSVVKRQGERRWSKYSLV